MIPSLPIAPAMLTAHENKFSILAENYEKNGKIHPTILVTGVEGTGKRSMVLHLVQRLFCDQPGKFLEACGECKSCKRSKQNQWLDLFWLEPEAADEDSGRLGIHKIEVFRELKTKLGLGPMEEPYKVVVIANADRMNTQAANSILKTLEEPPKSWIFILTATDASRLLPTIQSRCVEIKLRPLQAGEVYTILQQIQGSAFQSTRARVASRAAEGSITRAQYFLQEDTWNIRDQLLGFLSNPASEWMRLIETLSANQRTLQLSMDLIESLFMDLLKNSLEPNYSWIHEDQKEFLLQWQESKKITPQKIIIILSEIAEKRKFTTLTLNSKLLAQETLIPLLESIIS